MPSARAIGGPGHISSHRERASVTASYTEQGGGEALRGVAVEIADGRVDLGERDLHICKHTERYAPMQAGVLVKHGKRLKRSLAAHTVVARALPAMIGRRYHAIRGWP